MRITLFQGAVSRSIEVRAYDSTTWAPVDIANVTGLTAYYTIGDRLAPVSITLSNLSAITDAYSSGGFIKKGIGAVGKHRFDLPNAMLTGGETAHLCFVKSGVMFEPIDIDLPVDNLFDAPPTVAEIADAVLDEALAGHTAAGSAGKALGDINVNAAAILQDTGTDGVKVSSGTGAGQINLTAGVVLSVQSVNNLVSGAISNGAFQTDALSASKFNVDVAQEFAATLLVAIIEDGESLVELLRIIRAALAGKTHAAHTPAAPKYLSKDETKTRISAVVDLVTSERTAVTVDGS